MREPFSGAKNKVSSETLAIQFGGLGVPRISASRREDQSIFQNDLGWSARTQNLRQCVPSLERNPPIPKSPEKP